MDVTTRGNAVRGTSALYLQGIISNLIAFGFTIIITRLLGQTEFGQYSSVVMFVTLFATIGSLALSTPATRFIAKCQGMGDANQSSSTSTLLVSVGFFSSLVISSIAQIAFPTMFALMGVQLKTDFPWIFVAIDTFLTCFSLYLAGIIQGFGKYLLLAASLVVVSISRYGGALILLFLNSNIGCIFVGLALGNIVGTTIMTVIAIGLFYPFRRFAFSDLKEILGYAAPLFAALIIGQINSYIDRILLLSFMNVILLGIYSIGITLTMIYTLGSRALFNVAFPEQSKAWGEGKRNKLNAMTSRLARFVFLIFPPVVVYVSAVSFSLVSVFFDRSYIDASIVLLLVGLTYSVFCYDIIANGYLLAIGETKILLFGSITAALFGTATGIVLIPQFGIVGATLSRCLTISILSSYPLLWLNKKGLFKFNHRFHLKTLVSSLLIFPVVFVLSTILSPLMIIIVGGFVALTLYAVLLRAFGIINEADIVTFSLLFPNRMSHRVISVGRRLFSPKED